MKTISKCISAVVFRLNGAFGKSNGQDSLSDKLKTNRLSLICRHDPENKYCAHRSEIKLKHKPKWLVRFTRMAGYSLFILLSANSYLTTTVHAASIVETFAPLEKNFHDNYKSDIYEVWVKPIWYKKIFDELVGNPDSKVPFDPVSKGFEKSFTYISVNDIATNDTDNHSQCYQYFYDHPGPTGETSDDEVQYRFESIPDDSNNKGDHCDNSDKKGRDEEAYEVMTHSNNWTTFDVGNDVDINNNVKLNLGAVRIYIQLNSGHDLTNKGIKYDIRPKHAVTEDKEHTLGTDHKYIKVQKLSGVYVEEDSKLVFKKVLVLDVLQPRGTEWSGQFNVSFVNEDPTKKVTIIEDIKHPYASHSFEGELLEKHPLFIFANPLPKWYHIIADKSNYHGCPITQTDLLLPNSDLELLPPNNFFTPSGWKPGLVVKTITKLDKDGVLSDVSDSRIVDDLILKTYSKRLCIPGGVYVKGRIIHNNEYHTDDGLKLTDVNHKLSPGDTGDYNLPQSRNNAKGVKIVGRGILSGINIKYRTKKKSKPVPVDVCDTCPCDVYPTGGGWFGLIDIRHRGEAFTKINEYGIKVPNTDPVMDPNNKELDCYYRDEGKLEQDVNCVQGITMVDAPKASIYTGGSRMDVENVKMMSWHIETNGIGSTQGSKIKNVFIKVNDDSLVMGKSYMNIDNATVWRQRWGSVVNLSWKLLGYKSNGEEADDIVGSELNGLNVIRFDKGQTTNGNGNAAIVTARNLMGGTIKDFTFKDIVVEDPPYEIINLQLDDTNDHNVAKRKVKENQLDGIGTIENITFDGLFTPKPYEVDDITGEPNPLSIQKSVFSISDEMHYGEYDLEYVNECKMKCEKCGVDTVDECHNACDNEVIDHTGFNQLPIERSISGVHLNNICINEGDKINGDKFKGITTSNSSVWGVNIKDYFEFRDTVNYTVGLSTKDDPYQYTGKKTDFNGIRGEGPDYGSENSAKICHSLQAANMCTIQNYRKLCL